MVGHKICFYGKLWLIMPKLSLFPLLIWSTVQIIIFPWCNAQFCKLIGCSIDMLVSSIDESVIISSLIFSWLNFDKNFNVNDIAFKDSDLSYCYVLKELRLWWIQNYHIIKHLSTFILIDIEFLNLQTTSFTLVSM